MALTLAAKIIAFLSGGAAFIFFLVVSVSTSVADSLYFARYTFSGQRDLRLGIWGYCTYDVSSAGALLNKECVRKLGWNVPLFNGFPNYINSNESYPYVGGNLLKALVVFPLACGFAGLGCLAVLAVAELGVMTLGLSAALAFAGVIIQFLAFQFVDQHIRQSFETNTVTGGLRQCIWIALTGLIMIGIGASAAFMGTARNPRRHGSLKNHEKASERYL